MSTKEFKILKVKRTQKAIFIAFKKEDEEHDVTAHDNPLPSFYPSFDALAPLVCALCELPSKYTDGMTVTGVTLTKSGKADACLLIAKKTIEGNTRPFNIVTPLVLMDPPEAGEAAHLTTKESGLVNAVIEEAKKYVRGERAQGQIVFDTGGGSTEQDD
jgi:hypothetical protein